MIAFLDTEFTDLNAFPRLLSIGIVVGAAVAGDFYAEVTDLDRVRDASPYAKRMVLPQFGRVEGAACRYVEVGTRLWAFFDRQIDTLSPSEQLEVAFEYDLDWALMRLAIKDASRTCWKRLEGRLRPKNVYGMPGFQAGEAASNLYFEEQEVEPLSQHHALCDARALRIAYEVAKCDALGAPVAGAGDGKTRVDSRSGSSKKLESRMSE